VIFYNLDKIDQDLADHWGELSAAQNSSPAGQAVQACEFLKKKLQAQNWV